MKFTTTSLLNSEYLPSESQQLIPPNALCNSNNEFIVRYFLNSLGNLSFLFIATLT
jgi:hypothetical protein